ncbi:complement C3-like [Menidia menidia]
MADMGSGMWWSQLLLLVVVTFPCLISLADGSPVETMSAPNLLRVGTAENIFIEVQNCGHDNDIPVQINVMEFPFKRKILASTFVTLTKAKLHQDLGKIMIPTDDFSRDPNMKQYVYLQARFPDRLLEKVVMVSFQSGYLFIQTDKPIYTPESDVRYRVFAVTPGMAPIDRGAQTEIEIVSPEDIVVWAGVGSLRSGIMTDSYRLPSVTSFGMWKVLAKFHMNPQQTFAAEFEVKEHVVSSFEVKVTPASSFFLVDSESLTVNIKAKYHFGNEVDGEALVTFGIELGGSKRGLTSSIQRVPIQRGEGTVKLMKEHITKSFPNINELIGTSIFVAATVLTGSGGEMVESEYKGIKIVTSPYIINFKKTAKYFQPGMAFYVTIEVLNPDNTPAQGIAVNVNPGQVIGSTAASGTARFTINTPVGPETLTITARTNDPQLAPERQAAASMVARSFKAKSNSYLHIGVATAEVELGQYLRVSFIPSRQETVQKDITYLILSRGQLVKYGRQQIMGQAYTIVNLQITKEMLPSFRIVAYYHSNSDELISHSVQVDVKDSCTSKLKLELVGPKPSYHPRSAAKLKVTGDPQATVGLVAVDKSVLNNKNHLTQKRIWDTVEELDTGCTSGGGKDSVNVFYDAGLLFVTSTSETPDRTDSKCPVLGRRKRAISVMNVRTKLLSQYEDKEGRECCLTGMGHVTDSSTCEMSSRAIVNGSACIKAFVHCCKEMENQEVRRGEGISLRPRTKRAADMAGDSSYTDRNDISTRTNFPESWLWMDLMLKPCPPQDTNCVSSSTETNILLKDTITTWQLTGISMSATHGICVSDPIELRVKKDFFIDLRLPYSAVYRQQLEIKAILHNDSPDLMTVRVDLIEDQNVCSQAWRRGVYGQEVQVGAQSTRSVPFIIIPTRMGEVSIEVKASVRDSHLYDGIQKSLQVVPAGVLVKSVKVVTLNPKGGQQVEIINSEIPQNNLIPNSPVKTIISLKGDQTSPMLGNFISGTSMGTLIVQPSGSGEQNMIAMTLPVTATMYLDKTNQWDVVSLQKRKEALEYIKKGYQNELDYRKPDGSFSTFTNSQSSTWLTAYVAKVFAMVHDLIGAEKSVICDAIKFLILKTQQSNGKFTEVGKVFHTIMTGDVTGTDSDASMTAFCLIAMQETQSLCADTVYSLPNSKSKAVAYLDERLPHLTNPYAVAMTSYALANENKLNKEFLLSFSDPGQSHWPSTKGISYTLEATAYALLALVKAKAFDEARTVVRYLNQQVKLDGGYGSTQATTMVYQAVAEYWTSFKDIEYPLHVEILLPDRSQPSKYSVNRENQHRARISQFRAINKDIRVTAIGEGKATLTVMSIYYTASKETDSDCAKFDMKVQVLPETAVAYEKAYRLKIDVMYNDKDRDSSMSILDVGLPSGYIFNNNDLDALSRAGSISKYEANTVLSERGSLIIYKDKISNEKPEEISFRIHQKMKMEFLQPASVSVYEYYDIRNCVHFYHPERSGGLRMLCQSTECICAEDSCSKQKKGNINSMVRIERACESTVTGRTDFVYKVSVEEITKGISTDLYKMRIVSVTKVGYADLSPSNQLRTFIAQVDCREALDLKASKTYLIMGSSTEIHRDEHSSGYQYVLSGKTWIEYWPTDSECATEAYQSTCRDIRDMVEQLELFGCQN